MVIKSFSWIIIIVYDKVVSGYFRTGRLKLYDVVVIGGGPVGSYVAYKLAGMGYGVVVVEQKERLGERVCCTGIISQECVSSFAIDDNVILVTLLLGISSIELKREVLPAKGSDMMAIFVFLPDSKSFITLWIFLISLLYPISPWKDAVSLSI